MKTSGEHPTKKIVQEGGGKRGGGGRGSAGPKVVATRKNSTHKGGGGWENGVLQNERKEKSKGWSDLWGAIRGAKKKPKNYSLPSKKTPKGTRPKKPPLRKRKKGENVPQNTKQKKKGKNGLKNWSSSGTNPAN